MANVMFTDLLSRYSQTMEVVMLDDLRKCYKCGYETIERVPQCPQCGRRLLSTKQIRRLGWGQLLAGLFLLGLMGTITYSLAPSLLQPGQLTGGERFTGTPEQGLLILGLFGLVLTFGLTSLVSGLWQITTGRRNKWILYFSFVLFALLVAAGWIVRQVLGGSS